jgi:HAD superfamily hydrolase (TIGR01509 family)
MKIKLIIFDLDGVLVDSRKMHYDALNLALSSINESYIINYEEHIAKYDGLPTKKKLELLTNEKGLDPKYYDIIWKLKQEKTFEIIDKTYTYDERIRSILAELKKKNYLLYCASNSIWNTIKLMLMRKGLLEYFDYFISNEDVKNPKPFPEMYLQCIQRAKVSTLEVMICEDSHIGRKAALDSGACLCPIEDPDDFTLGKINKYLSFFENQTLSRQIYDLSWKKPINIVIPMAGYGSRFANVGYAQPKPLIEINGKPMIQIVVENLNIDGNYIFIVREEHYDKYDLKHLLNKISPNCKIIKVNKVTEGAACTVLLAKEYIDNNMPLLIANSDQYLEWNSNEFLYSASSDGIDGCISTFYNTHPKWSYAKLDSDGFVTEVQEKNPISTIATTGIYYWKHGCDFVKYANLMIEKNIKVNNEFYVCPVYNEAISDYKKIKVFDCNRFWGIGIPEDLNYFTQNFDLSKL